MATTRVIAEMTAAVMRVVARVGGQVDEGDQLLVVESMKMEIPIVAPVAGTVAEVNVEPDDLVAEGDTLVVIESVT